MNGVFAFAFMMKNWGGCICSWIALGVKPFILYKAGDTILASEIETLLIIQVKPVLTGRGLNEVFSIDRQNIGMAAYLKD